MTKSKNKDLYIKTKVTTFSKFLRFKNVGIWWRFALANELIQDTWENDWLTHFSVGRYRPSKQV